MAINGNIKNKLLTQKLRTGLLVYGMTRTIFRFAHVPTWAVRANEVQKECEYENSKKSKRN